MHAAQPRLSFGLASHPADFAQIRRLNYRTFVEEIPQHAANADGVLVDRFERESTFIVARMGGRIVGMLAMRARRPFSLDTKLPDLDRYLPRGKRCCEVRLLAVDPAHRGGAVLRGLLEETLKVGESNGFDVGVISATVRQLRLYEKLGFVAFGPLVGTPGAEYQPMYVTRRTMMKRLDHLIEKPARVPQSYFLPGPVTLAPAVRRRLGAPLVSHRGEVFARDLATIRSSLRTLVGARHVAVCAGSGTLANDIVAAQLALSGRPVVVVANGEFGYRLADQARRHHLAHTVLGLPWGEPLTDEELDDAFARTSGAGWLWAVHCETSTGMLHDVAQLSAAAARHGARLALDAVSSVGAAPLDLSPVAFASAASGKGLGAAAGLALVCAADAVAPRPDALPSYLDLGLYLEGDGTPFTQPSALVGALAEALMGTDWPERFAAIRDADAGVRARLAEAGHRALIEGPRAAPAVSTWVVPRDRDVGSVATRLEHEGYLLGWRSGYLRERRWIQTAFMGDFPRERVAAMADALARELGQTS